MTSITNDYYQVLGVSYDDPSAKIKARYRLLARNTHPDAGGADQGGLFTAYAQAYRVLGNADQRERYNESLGILIRPRPLRPGIDLHQRVIVTPEEAERGGDVPLAFVRYEPCSRCWLAGCQSCQGQGLLPTGVQLTISLSAQTRNRAVVFVEGQGGCSEPGGERGNLFVYVT